MWRSTEIRAITIELDETAKAFIQQENHHIIRIVANRRNKGDEAEYEDKEQEVRDDNHIPVNESILFLEINISDASEFSENLKIQGVQVGHHRILRSNSAAVPNAIAAILIWLREETGKIPHAYFGWPEGNPIQYLLRFLLFGEGDIAVVTREVLRRAEKDPSLRPAIHVGG